MIAKTILLTLCATLATACAGTHANQATAAAATAPTHTCHHTGAEECQCEHEHEAAHQSAELNREHEVVEHQAGEQRAAEEKAREESQHKVIQKGY